MDALHTGVGDTGVTLKSVLIKIGDISRLFSRKAASDGTDHLLLLHITVAHFVKKGDEDKAV